MSSQNDPPVQKDEAIANLREYAKSTIWKESTIASYVRVASQFADWCTENGRPFLSPNDQTIDAFFQSCNQARIESGKNPLSKRTTNTYRNAIKALIAANRYPQLTLEQSPEATQPPEPKLSGKLFQMALEAEALENSYAELQTRLTNALRQGQESLAATDRPETDEEATPDLEAAIKRLTEYLKANGLEKSITHYTGPSRAYILWCQNHQISFLDTDVESIKGFTDYLQYELKRAAGTINNARNAINHLLRSHNKPPVPR